MKILAADDHALIREGLRAILKGFSEEVDLLEAWDGASVEKQLATNSGIELLLLDVHLPDCDGMVLLSSLVIRYPTLPIVMISAEYDSDIVSSAINRGAAGFLPKTSLNQILVSALQLVLSGGIYIPPEILRKTPISPQPSVMQQQSTARKDFVSVTTPDSLGLTERQIEVFKRLMEAKSNKQICRELDLAEATVKVHVRAILRALGANSRTEAVVAATRLNLLVDGAK
ncbi:MAG: response regulator transcription factor [Nitrosomonas ureae]